MPSRGILALLAATMTATAILAFGCSGAEAPKYPTKPIEVVMGNPAGSGGDVLMRSAAKYLSKDLGVSINVVNRPGGNGVPAVQSIMPAPPDGYTLLGDAAMTSAYQMVTPDLPYKVEDRTFIAKINNSPFIFYVDPKMPWKSLADVAKDVKAKPADFVWGGAGGMSGTDFSQMQFFDKAGLDIAKMKKVVYNGTSEILAAAAGGHVQFGGGGASGAPPFVQSGKVRALAITGEARLKVMPEVPAAKEAGYAGVDVGMWIGLSGPPKIPQAIVDRLNAAVKKITTDPEFISEMDKVAGSVRYVGPEDMRKEVVAEAKDAEKLAKLGAAVK